MFERIPQELKERPQWVCWCSDKLPKNPKTGGNAMSNNPTTWGTFQEALEAMDKYRFDGVGFMFAPPYFGVDLDKCIDNSDFVDEFVEGLQSYNEYSRSGQGIHIICKGTLPEGGRRRGNVEMYSEGRYFIMTGKQYNEEYHEIVDCTEKIKPLHAKYIPSNRTASVPRAVTKVSMSDMDLLQKARESRQGSLFQMLYSGQWEGLYNSQSEADMALCNILAFWTQKDKSQMDRLFRSSGLMRPKWDRAQSGTTYGSITLDTAILSCSSVYEERLGGDRGNAPDYLASRRLSLQDEGAADGSNVYDMTDTGNARRLYDRFGADIRYSYNRKGWFYWTGRKWQLDEDGEIKRLADIIVDDLKKEAVLAEDAEIQKQKMKFAYRTAGSSAKEAFVKETCHLEDIPVSPNEFDSYDMYLNAQNGIVSLRNGELIEHSREYMMSKIATVEMPLERGEPRRWMQFLDEITGGDKELQKYLQKCVGYSLTGDTSEQCMFFLYGMGNNGKSTFLDTISAILGDYASNTQPDTLMVKKTDGVSSDIARLKSARFVTCEEPTEGVRLNEGLVKQLTGGGKVTCRFLYGNEFEYEPEFKIWISTNHKPVIRGTDVGIWRRVRLIPFVVSIPAEKVDKHLRFKLLEEYPQILRWAVDGCRLWQEEGLGMPECVKQATEEYKQEMDLLQSFVESRLQITNFFYDQTSATELYNAYRQWARDNGEYEMTSRRFGTEITKKLPEKHRTGNGICYTGVKLIG